MKKTGILVLCTVLATGSLCGCMGTVEPVGKPLDDDSIPEKFSLVEENRVPGVRSCEGVSDVPYALIGAAESNIITQGLEAPEKIDLSENHLCYYSGITVPSLMDISEDFEGRVTDKGRETFYGISDAPENYITCMANGVGLELESRAPMSKSGLSRSIYNMETLEKMDIVSKYSGEYILTDYSVISDKIYEKDSGFDKDDIKNIKKAVMENGAVFLSPGMDSKYVKDIYGTKVFYNFDRANGVYYTSENNSGNLNIVGWDDSFPAENFDIDGTIPKKDGAWLCRAFKEDYGDENGCIWVSYEEQSVLMAASLSFKKYKYGNAVARYDETGYHDSIKSGYDFTTVANVFSGMEGQLNAVGVTTLCNDQNIRIRVYKNPDNGIPDSGQLVMDSTQTISYQGYHAIDIDADMTVTKNDSFSICVGYENDKDDKSMRGKVPVEGVSMGMTFVSSGSGQSYFYDGGDWVDLYDEQTAELFGKEKLGNCCIKALLTQ